MGTDVVTYPDYRPNSHEEHSNLLEAETIHHLQDQSEVLTKKGNNLSTRQNPKSRPCQNSGPFPLNPLMRHTTHMASADSFPKTSSSKLANSKKTAIKKKTRKPPNPEPKALKARINPSKDLLLGGVTSVSEPGALLREPPLGRLGPFGASFSKT